MLKADNILENLHSGEQFSNSDENFMLTVESHCSSKKFNTNMMELSTENDRGIYKKT